MRKGGIKNQSARWRRFILPVAVAILFSQCETIDPEEDIPSYIHIEHINFTTDAPKQGSSSSSITDAWVYVDNDFLGAYELPATIPVLKSGVHAVTVKGGIMINGVGSNRTPYPFYTSYEKSIQLIPQTPVTVSPETGYLQALKFGWTEDFENTPISLSKTSKSDTSIGITTDPTLVFEGKRSGVIHLDNKHTFGEFISNNNFALPKEGKPVYLELNYKTNHPFMVGVYANTNNVATPYSVGGGKATNTWKKMYIDLTTAVSSNANADHFTIFVSMLGDKTISFPALYLDNLKLVYL